MARRAMKHLVIDTHRQHRDWTPQQIAQHLNCSDAYVRATAQRNGLVLPSGPHGGSRKPYFPSHLTNLLERHADVRGVSARELAIKIVSVVAQENMVDAVLDDGVSA